MAYHCLARAASEHRCEVDASKRCGSHSADSARVRSRDRQEWQGRHEKVVEVVRLDLAVATSNIAMENEEVSDN